MLLVMYLFVPFLIIARAPPITGRVVVLRGHIFSISISRSLYLLNNNNNKVTNWIENCYAILGIYGTI